MAIPTQANYAIEQAVSGALHADEQLAGKEITVRVTVGKIILQGAVNTLAELNHAGQVAAGVDQANQVENNLSLSVVGRPGDETVAAAIAQELHDRPALKQLRLGVSVKEGRVTLAGAVETLEQKLEAHEVASGIKGVIGIINLLDLSAADSGKDS